MMEVRETNYFDFCHGCLSFGRRCSMDSDNVSLFYQLLDPINTMKEPSSLLLCWECEAILKKIRLFQYKVNKAQAHLQDVIFHKIEHKSLSTLIITTKNIYDLTVNSKTPDTQLSFSLKDDGASTLVLNKLKSSDCKILKVPLKNYNDDSNSKDIKAIDYKYEIEVGTQEIKTETNLKCNLKDERITFDNPDSSLLKLEHPNVDFNKSQKLKIKRELEDLSSEDDNFNPDNIIRNETAKKIKTKLLKKKYKLQARVQPNRAIRVLIDYDNVEKYFDKVVLPPDSFRTQLNKWAKENYYNKSIKYKCTACAMVFHNQAEELSHKELHNNITKHRCDLCNLSFKSEVELVSHGAAHEFQQCVICFFVCRTPDAREAHLNVTHPRGFWQCDQCALTFRRQTELTAHRDKLHRTFICNYCNIKRNSKDILQKHILANHMPLKIKCHLCGIKLRRRCLKEHLVNIHHILSNASKESTYCVECNKQYNTMRGYKGHLRRMHEPGPKKPTPVPCPECGKIYTKRTFKNHWQRFHGEGTKHRCDTCNKSYSTASCLRRHIECYHKKIPLPKNKVCKECGLGFQTNRILIHHMRTHTGERPHECSYCPARFAQKYARDVHVRKQHLKNLQQFIT